MKSDIPWQEALDLLHQDVDREKKQRVLDLLHKELKQGREPEPAWCERLEAAYQEAGDPWLAAELKRLSNRIRSRRLLGRDLLRLQLAEMDEAEQGRVLADLQGLQEVYAGHHQAGESLESRYEIQELIGRGGLSAVFRAIRRSDQREVALKFLNEEHLQTPSLVARFQRECRLTRSFDHPRVIKVFEAGEHTGRGFLVMEYLPLGGADSLLGHGELSPVLCLELIRQGAEALAYIHKQGVVHRDVKLSNLLLAAWEAKADRIQDRIAVKLSDFGLSKESTGEGLTRTGTLMGTDFYMAPEQQTSAKEADHRADIYSLGVSLYRLASGQGFPVGAYEPLHELRPELPRQVDDLLWKCLQSDPVQRWDSAGDLARELEAIMSEMGEEGDRSQGSGVRSQCGRTAS